jgi:YbbR domain-containing protein
VPDKERVQIILFDITGKEIVTFVNEEKLKGEYEVVLDMSKYSAGTYFYRMQAGEMSDSKTIILNK